MKYIIKIALLSVLIMSPNWAVAENSNPTHTHTNTPIELEFVSSQFGTQYAAVCFLGTGDCGEGGFAKGDGDMNIDTAKQCQNEGFNYTISNCALPKFLDGQCPYNSAYYQECKQDIPRACKEAGYSLASQCASGQKLKKTPRCQWDNNYGICCKESCPANSSLTCNGAVAGNDTCGYDCKKCCEMNCPSGTSEYNSNNGCGGSTKNGCNTKTCYYPYKECCNSPCFGYSGYYPGGCEGYVDSCYDNCDNRQKYRCVEYVNPPSSGGGSSGGGGSGGGNSGNNYPSNSLIGSCCDNSRCPGNCDYCDGYNVPRCSEALSGCSQVIARKAYGNNTNGCKYDYDTNGSSGCNDFHYACVP